MASATRGAKRLRAVQSAHFVLELEDLLKEIFRHLDLGAGAARAMRVCRQWRRVLGAAVASRLTFTLEAYATGSPRPGDPTGLALPHGVGMMPQLNGGEPRLMVADTRNDRLVEFDNENDRCRPHFAENMSRPRTLTTLAGRTLYVTSFTQNNIVRIRWDEIGGPAADVVSSEGDLWSPEGVCIHRGRLYCCSLACLAVLSRRITLTCLL